MLSKTGTVTRSKYVPSNKPFALGERERATKNVSDGFWSVEEAAEKIGCSPSSVKKWKKQYENGQHMYEYLHRPSLISPEHRKHINEEIDEKSKCGVLVSKRKFGTLLQCAANSTSNDENKDTGNLSKRYIRDYINNNNLNVANAEVIDKAHLVALNDPRHAASFAAMMHHLHQSVPTGLYFNVDKSRFDLRKDEQETAPAVYSGKRPRSIKCDDPYPTGSNGNCSVHLLAIANDGGKLANMVYVVKDNQMPADAVDFYEAPMLDGSTNADGTAFLLFIGESTPNKDTALIWVFSEVLLPFIQKVRLRLGKNNTILASLTIDGDPRQLQVITSAATRTAFSNENVIVGKFPASCTPIFQPLDVGKVFLAAKTRFRTLIEEGYAPDSEVDDENLLEIFRSHRRKYPKAYKKNKMPSEAMGSYFSDIMKCLHTAAAALRTTAVSSVVKDSFKSAGVSPFNVQTIRKKCQYRWTRDQEQLFDHAVPELSAIFARNFELKEKDFDNAHIPANNESKDGVSVSRRRALLLFAPHVLLDLQNQVTNKSRK